jgi:hypothetical protein
MFRIPHAPTRGAHTHELADFVEWQAWNEGSCSSRSVNSAIDQLDDNFDIEGIMDDSDKVGFDLEEAFLEIQKREAACNGAYPFTLDATGTVLRFTGDTLDFRQTIYLYLLLGTRLNMQTDKVHSEIDGTLLLEELGAELLKQYFGADRTETMVFGTAAPGGFVDKVNSLCSALQEGGCFYHHDSGRVCANDAGLDVVAWKHFSDSRPGKLIVFAQCKTGTSWHSQIGELNPEAFLNTWTHERTFQANPLRALIVAEAINPDRWGEITGKATKPNFGLFFERCRIVDYIAEINNDLKNKIGIWVQEAFCSRARQ